ncbi:M15 family metallopeptidase [Rodentibacter pneumotropicus]|uniref:M15 family metallopeptidase n=1 Tax=Rodentibacter pneumotropicus TaxID=758 RepID=UPI000379DB6C|nr:M15 family metallopeptidase [Rodentibacter pneumotropicus]NBH75688.1 D-alanyl-D-alanine carboxypeptidase family protein [Rodentibacter pneumotropicus]OOF60954.1 peptidase M15 [Rodentibacter pneumotropicus]THA03922.1 D-alanyl-D-alanine carboxypeptidase family protein [Rodentibacter pneumotropicus]THA06307.1 D-alanyl-D-alanine carboxypeptidase family protein [Rodentibacter pneumotropicus]THA12728.1 D-alanyl-D-alanine carboxypeptidase family protein [Rodentibacter pneumotropicus]
MKLTTAMLTGKSREHLVNLPCPFSTNHFLQKEALLAFQSLQQCAVKNGFNLQPASSFRDFQRQQLIWNGKFSGERKVHDDEGHGLDLTLLDDWQKCQAILRWSALPGGSRHHWGTEIDIFDPDLLPQGQSLQLEPWEYEKGGYFFELSEFLIENLPHFDFTLPFMQQPIGKKIGREPWHISYLPLAELARMQFSPEILLHSWQNEEIGGKDILRKHIDQIFEQFVI